MSGRGRPPGSGGGHGRGGGNNGNRLSNSSSPSRGSSPSSGSRKFRGASQSPRGRGQRGRPPKFHNQLSRASSSSPVKRRLSLDEEDNKDSVKKSEKRSKKHRRPKFQDNPPAPEIVEVEKRRQQLQQEKEASSSSSSSASSSANNSHNSSREERDMKSLDCDGSADAAAVGNSSSSSIVKREEAASNGHAEEEEEEEGEKEVGALSSSQRKRGLVSDKTPVDGVDAKKARVSESEDKAAISGLVGDMVRKLDDASVTPAAVNGEVVQNGEEVLTFSRSLRVLRDNLEKAVREYESVVGEDASPKDLRLRLCEVATSSAAESFELSDDKSVRRLLAKFVEEHKLESVSEEGEEDGSMQKSLVEALLTAYRKPKVVRSGSASAPHSPRKPVSTSGPCKSADASDDESKANGSKRCFDKSRLFSQMEDKFAKETHDALKNKPVYKRRINSESAVKSEEEAGEGPPKIVAMTEPGEVVEDSQPSSPPSLSAAVALEVDEKESTVVLKFDSVSSSNAKPASETVSEDKVQASVPVAAPTAEDQVSTTSNNVPTSSNSQVPQQESTSTSVGSSELTKSLRQVRVRRSRTSSTNGGSSVSLDNPPTLEAEGERTPPQQQQQQQQQPTTPESPRVIRPKLLLSPKRRQLSLSDNKPSPTSSPSSPLKIDIPDQPKHHQHHGHHSSSYNRRSLLTTPGAMSKHRRRHRRVAMQPTILNCGDASATATAVVVDISTLNSRLNGSEDTGNISSSGQPSLKTVIRLPKGDKGVKGKKGHHHHHHKKKKQQQNDSQNHLSTPSTRNSRLSPPASALRQERSTRNGCTVYDYMPDDFDEAGLTIQNPLIAPHSPMDVSSAVSPPSLLVVAPATSTSNAAGAGRTRTPDSQIGEANLAAESMVVPEKASSFNIHPERCCSDICHYCSTRFGSLDTPLHVSQLKTQEYQRFAMDFAAVSAEACLCDKCYRYIDRKAKEASKSKAAAARAAAAAGDDSDGAREKIKACIVRTCNREVTDTITRKWLIRLRKKLSKRVNLNWERVTKASAKATFPICQKHLSLANSFSVCSLCRRQMALGTVAAIALVSPAEDAIPRLNAALREEGIPSDLHEQSILCKLCRAYCNIKVQESHLENKPHRSFAADYQQKLYQFLDLHPEAPTPPPQPIPPRDAPSPKKIHHVTSQSDNPTKITIKTTTLGVSGGNNGEQQPGKPGRKRKPKEFVSPGSDAHIQVASDVDTGSKKSSNGGGVSGGVVTKQAAAAAAAAAAGGSGGSGSISGGGIVDTVMEKCNINISFDMNTKKLWQDLHFPYGTYTSFFRHLILLEKYWRSGDLVLRNGASPKAEVYIKSVRNRIDAYEGQHKRSGHDLSASTRPDLSVPAAPDMLHLPDEEDKDEVVVVDDEPSAKQARKEDASTILKIPNFPVPNVARAQQQSPPGMPTKIRVRTDLMHLGLKPKVDEVKKPQKQPQVQHQQILQQHLTRGNNEAKKDSFKIADLVATKAPQMPATNSLSKSPLQPNLLQLLNEPPGGKNSSKVSSGPLLGNTSLIGSTGKKTSSPVTVASSNSQLFKSSGGGNSSSEQGSSAIPLTFNNSIAEVLAAASKAKQAKEAEAAAAAVAAAAGSGKPEVTITAKPVKSVAKPTPVRQQQQQQPQQLPSVSVAPSTSSFSSLLGGVSSTSKLTELQQQQLHLAQKLWAEEELTRMMAKAAAAVSSTSTTMAATTTTSATRTTGLLTSPSPSGGVSSIQKPLSTTPKTSNINSSTGVSNISQIHPLLDMNKLLHSTSPGIAPHIVAQTALPSTSSSKPSQHQKIAPKPGPMPTQVRPVQLSKPSSSSTSAAVPQGIQTVNKKSLNTVLDRLSGLKTTSTVVSSTPTLTPSMPKTTSSSLVQQLQAPPMSLSSTLNSSLSKALTVSSSPTKNKSSSSLNTSPMTSTNSSAAAALTAAANSAATLAALNPFGLGGFPATQMVGQPMVQFPTAAAWTQQQQQQQQQAAAQQAALLMAAAGGAAAGIPGMTHQQAAAAMQELVKMSLQQQQQPKASTSSASRLRAPPPLTHMGRQSGSGGGAGKTSGGGRSND